MNCEEVMELMQRDLDQDLSDRERQNMLNHMAGCPECAAMHARLLKLSAELESLPAVLPPFSIVDSILPRLAELGEARDQQGASTAPRPLSFGRKGRNPFSWKIAAGAAAAAAVLGIFLFNPSGSMRFNADGWLNKSSKSAASDSAARPKADAPASGGGSVAAGAAESTSKNADPTAPAAVAQPEDSAALGGADNVMTFSERVSSDAKSKQPSANPTGAPGKDAAKRIQGAASRGIAAAPDGSPGTASGMVEPPKASGDNQVTYSPNKAGVAPPSAAGSSGSPAARAFAAPADNGPLPSESGKYTAVVEQQRVRIHAGDSSGDVVYVSKQWKAGDSLSLVSWNKDGQVDYEVRGADGSVQRYTIDLVFHTEMKK